jgi:hypothetical protein
MIISSSDKYTNISSQPLWFVQNSVNIRVCFQLLSITQFVVALQHDEDKPTHKRQNKSAKILLNAITTRNNYVWNSIFNFTGFLVWHAK